MNQTTYKLCLIGARGSGKSTWVKKLFTGDAPTLDVEVWPINITNNICFGVWDTAGQEKFGGFREGHCAVAMFDTTSNTSWKNTLDFIKAWTGPLVVIGNKTDLQKNNYVVKELLKEQLQSISPHAIYMEMSVKNNSVEELQRPLHWLVTQLQKY